MFIINFIACGLSWAAVALRPVFGLETEEANWRYRNGSCCTSIVDVLINESAHCHCDREPEGNAKEILSDANIPLSEFQALYALFYATDGDNWRWRNLTHGEIWNFSSSTNNPCVDKWQGLNCSYLEPYDTYHITELRLNLYNLVGSIPEDIGNLTKIEQLSLDGNWLSGTIPSTFKQFENLVHLDLERNSLNGTLPSFLGDYQYLKRLLLGLNAFTGTIPSSLCNLPSLVTLAMGNNNLEGSIPDALGNLRNLAIFNAEYNALTGTLPESVGALSNIQSINIFNNSVSGTLSESLGNLWTLRSITLGGNKFEGPLPSSYGQLQNLTFIDLHRNRLTGTIPAQWTNLKSLLVAYLNENYLEGSMDVVCSFSRVSELFLQFNLFNGTLPTCTGDLTHLTELYAYKNHLTGTLPSSLHQLNNSLVFLDLNYNMLTGTIPASFASLHKLVILALFNNFIHGSIPTGFQKLPNLAQLLLQNNLLSGSIEKIFNATVQHRLQAVQLSGNQLTGLIPAEPFKIATLAQFSVVDNCLSGSLPIEICDCQELTILAMDGVGSSAACRVSIVPGLFSSYEITNPLPDGVPACLFQLPNLITLHLSGNGLTGSLPYDLQLGHSLIDLALSHNRLTGPIPRAIQERSWYSLDLAYNRFSGTLLNSFNTQPVHFAANRTTRFVDIELAYLTQESQLNLDNNRLSGGIPTTVYSLNDISILDGNIFACNWRQDNLPTNDDARHRYQCGSNTFNTKYYAWLIVTGCVSLAVFVLWRRSALCEKHFPRVYNAVRALREWNDVLNARELEGKLPSFRFASAVTTIIGRVAFAATALIVAVIAPIYALLGMHYGTMTYQYAWSVSALFQSGYVPFCVTLVLYILLLVAVLLYLRRSAELNLTRPAASDKRSSWKERIVSVVKEAENAQTYAAYATFFVVNFAIVIGANLGFVYIDLYGNNTQLQFAQFALSVFKGLWNGAGSNLVLRWTFQFIAIDAVEPDFVSTLLFASLMNNIAIPCMTIALISPNCFYNLFVAAPSVEYKYIYLECAIFLPSEGRCIIYHPRVATTSYQPPFNYSYQCGAQYVTSYAATFVYLALEVAFVLPLVVALRAAACERATPGTKWYNFVHSITPAMLKPLSADDESIVLHQKPFHHTYDVNKFLVQLLTYLGVVLTFGLVFPPLAAAMLVAILSLIATNKLVTGRFIHSALRLDAALHLDVLDKDCQGVASKHLRKLKRAAWMLIWFSCFFYAVFFFDTLGNEVGLGHAYWVLVLLPLISYGLYGLERVRRAVYARYLLQNLTEAADNAPSLEMKGVQGAGSATDLESECDIKILQGFRQSLHSLDQSADATVSAMHK